MKAESRLARGAKKRDRGKKALSKHGTVMICSADPEDPDTYRWREYTGLVKLKDMPRSSTHTGTVLSQVSAGSTLAFAGV